ncbi:MAG: HlyD family efflux transporter periplasmic adaptor subunit [Pseudomonadota bacterium]
MAITSTSAFVMALLLVPLVLFDGCTKRDTNVALGVTSRERIALTATASETITELPKQEGQTVAVGDVLVRLDTTLQQANVALAKAELAQATANLAKLQIGAREEEVEAARADVAGARASLVSAETTYERNRRLFQRGTVSEAVLDVDLADRDSARAQLRHAEETLLELINGTRPEDLAIAQAEVDSATAKLAAEERKLEDLVIVATRSGILDSLPWNLGERASLGSPVAVLLADEEAWARVYIPEPYRARLKEGDRIEVRVDGIDTAFEGQLRWISADPAFTPYYALNQSERSRLMYLADIVLPAEASEIPVGVPAQAFLP